MIKTFSAIFENGVFRPVEPVDFPEHCQVRLDVRSVEPTQRHKRGVSAILGQWPGDESDDEIAVALKELS